MVSSDMPRLLFIHIPRCAGMSFYYFLEELYGKAACVRFGDSASVDRLLHGDRTCDEKDVVAGHVSLRHFQDHVDVNGRLLLSFVRKPWQREHSVMKYAQSGRHVDNAGLAQLLEQQSMGDLLASRADLRNSQCSYFAEDRTFESAKASIESAGVLLFDTDWIGVAAARLRQARRLPNFPAIHNGTEEPKEEDAELFRQWSRAYCSEDERLYQWAVATRSIMHDRLLERLSLHLPTGAVEPNAT